MAIINGTSGNDTTDATNGTSFDDTINLFGGDDQTRPGDGADLIFGGAGIDRISYLDATSAVTVDLLTGGTLGWANGDVYDSIENIFGTRFSDSLSGDTANNSINGFSGDDTLVGRAGDDIMLGEEGVDTLYGGNGNDLLVGGEGADTFNGGSGIDVISYFDSDAGVTANLATGAGSGGDAAGDTFRNIEAIEGSSFNDQLTGDASGNFLFGGSGRDTLDGGAGADTMSGGLGNDLYIVDNAGDVIDGEIGFSQGGGIDTVRSFVDFVTEAGSGIEIVRLGNETDTDNTNVTGSGAPMSLVGNNGNNAITGGFSSDKLTGKAGNDILTGGRNADTMSGNEGADTFVYTRELDSGVGQDNRDFINGFSHGFDIIDLSQVDANNTTGGDDAFVFIGNAGFSGEAGEMRTIGLNGVNAVILAMDTDGDRSADMQIFINQTNFMTSSDFIL